MGILRVNIVLRVICFLYMYQSPFMQLSLDIYTLIMYLNILHLHSS